MASKVSWALLAIGAMIVSSGVSSAGPSARLGLICEVKSANSNVDSRLKKDFCKSLSDALQRQTDINFIQNDTSASASTVIRVTMTLRSPFVADIRLEVGSMKFKKFVQASIIEQQLRANDHPITAFSATSLVLPIRKLLGLK